MLEKLLAAEVLEVRVLHTALAQNLVGEVVGAGSLASRRARIIYTASAARQDATPGFRRSSIGEAFRGHESHYATSCLRLSSPPAARDRSGGRLLHLLLLVKFFAISPAKGAETIVYLASSPDVATTTGQLFRVPPDHAVETGTGKTYLL
jgi:hypothetical protein